DNPKVIKALEVFAQLIAQQLEGARREVALQHAHDVLERRNEQLATFASVASHDLRSPLRGIGNLAGFLQEELGETGGAATDYARQIASSVRRMTSLVDGVLDYAHAGEEPLAKVDIHLGALVQTVSELFSPLGAQIVGENTDHVVRARQIPLQHVLSNLVDNGIKHARRSDVRIRIAFQLSDDEFHCSVTDNGPGIPPQYRERVFGLFQSLEPSARNERVSGVGLAIVKKLVEKEGGRVWIEEATGEGARFCFTWPR
ncbi:MAG: sensor histidine kinase, partial [Archangium sp.]